MTVNYLPTKRSNIKRILVIAAIIGIYLVENSPVKGFVKGSTFTYIIMPVSWILVIFIWKMTRKIRPMTKIKHKRSLKFWASYFGLMYIVINMLGGLVDGFGRSPYNHTIGGIIVNVIFVGTALVGRECLRGTLINSGRKQENIILFILVALLMTVVKYPITRYMTIRTVEGLIQFAAQHFLPNLTNSIFASYLVFVGGPLTSVIYLGMIEAFIWISPILPNLKWITSAFIGIMSPIFFMMFFSELPLSQESRQRKKEKYEDSTLSWVITTVVSIGLIWFAVGVFPVYPSVIATGSMKPIINPGDIILVKKITNTRDMEDIKEGDIIQFRKDSILISHRIIGIEKVGGGNIQFITKGDNNKEIDWEPVSSQNVKGMVKHILPKIGWPTLLIKGNRDIDIEKKGF